MKKVLILIWLVFVFHVGRSQSIQLTPDSEYSNDKDELFFGDIILPHSFLLFGSELGGNEQALIVKEFTQDGIFIRKLQIPLSMDSSFSFFSVLKVNTGYEIWGYSALKSQDTSVSIRRASICVVHVNDSLNHSSIKFFKLPFNLSVFPYLLKCRLGENLERYGGLACKLNKLELQYPGRFDEQFATVYFFLDSNDGFKCYMDSSNLNDYTQGAEILKQIGKGYVVHRGADNNFYENSFRFKVLDSDFKDLGYRVLSTINGPYDLLYSIPFYSPYFSLLTNREDSNSYWLAGRRSTQDHVNSFFIAERVFDTLDVDFPNLKSTCSRRIITLFETYDSYENQVPALVDCLDQSTHGDFVFAGMLNYTKFSSGSTSFEMPDTLLISFVNSDLSKYVEKRISLNEMVTINQVSFVSDSFVLLTGYTQNFIKDPSNLSKDYFAMLVRISNEHVGFDDISEEHERFQVFPNPLSGQFWVNCSFEVNSFEVMNLVGEAIWSDKVESTDFHVKVPFSLPGGVYLLKVNAFNGNSYFKRIVIEE